MLDFINVFINHSDLIFEFFNLMIQRLEVGTLVCNGKAYFIKETVHVLDIRRRLQFETFDLCSVVVTMDWWWLLREGIAVVTSSSRSKIVTRYKKK